MAVEPQRVAVVTDSTADLPNGLVERIGLRVVPMSVTFGTTTEISRVTMDDESFYERLAAATSLPTTAQPNPHWFVEAWQDAADDGCPGVVSLHVSRELSGTVSQAEHLARTAPLPVTVVDSGQVAGGLALMVIAAHHAAAAGRDATRVAEAARAVSDRVSNAIVVDTMEYLRRGGRVSGATATIGRALRVRPILAVQDGRIEGVARARTLRAGIDRMVDRIEDQHGEQPLAVVVTHGLAPAAAALAWERLADRLVVDSSITTVFGPVLGTHVGPGAVAIAVAPAELVGSLVD